LCRHRAGRAHTDSPWASRSRRAARMRNAPVRKSRGDRPRDFRRREDRGRQGHRLRIGRVPWRSEGREECAGRKLQNFWPCQALVGHVGRAFGHALVVLANEDGGTLWAAKGRSTRTKPRAGRRRGPRGRTKPRTGRPRSPRGHTKMCVGRRRTPGLDAPAQRWPTRGPARTRRRVRDRCTSGTRPARADNRQRPRPDRTSRPDNRHGARSVTRSTPPGLRGGNPFGPSP
jgi:hypothetical protein